jgi:hypothetical protein
MMIADNFQLIYQFTESTNDNIKIMRSDTAIPRECALQKSLFDILFQNDIFLDNAIAIQRIFKAVGIK